MGKKGLEYFIPNSFVGVFQVHVGVEMEEGIMGGYDGGHYYDGKCIKCINKWGTNT